MKKPFTESTWRMNLKFRQLCNALSDCTTPEEVADFLRDVTTLSEMEAMSERLDAAILLAQGLPYREVALRTGASTTTVTRVAQFLFDGQGGYRKYIDSHHTNVLHSRMGRGRRR